MLHPCVSCLFFWFRIFSAFSSELWAIPEPGLVRCGWFSSARRDSGPFLKTAALFYTCLFLFGWLDWRAEINITWRRSLHVQRSWESGVFTVALKKESGICRAPAKRTNTHMHAQTLTFTHTDSTSRQLSINCLSRRRCLFNAVSPTFSDTCQRRSLLLYMVPYVSRGDWQESRAATLPCCGFPILLWLLSFFLSLVYIPNVCWKSLTS